MKLQQFAKNWNMSLPTARTLRRLVTLAGQYNEHYCNGDPHKKAIDRTDKNECSQLWSDELDKVTEEITELVKPYGFTVEYNGLYPSLIKDNQTVFVP